MSVIINFNKLICPYMTWLTLSHINMYQKLKMQIVNNENKNTALITLL